MSEYLMWERVGIRPADAEDAGIPDNVAGDSEEEES